MPQGVAAEVGQQNRILLAFLKHRIVAVPNNPSDGLIQGSLIKCAAITVQEDEIRIAVNGHLTYKPHLLLVLPFHQERFFHETQHRYLPFTGFRLGGVNIEVNCVFDLVSLYSSLSSHG